MLKTQALARYWVVQARVRKWQDHAEAFNA
jgi:hypothetical protein